MTIESFVENKTEKEKGDAEASQLEELTRILQRVQADFDNYRKRMQSENHAQFLRGKATALKDVLAFVDTLNAAVETEKGEAKRNLESLQKSLQQILEQNGVKSISVLNQSFDPFTSECLMQENDSTKKVDIVLEEIQKGYYFHGDVLRPAKVKVNKIEKIENSEKENQTNTIEGGNKNE